MTELFESYGVTRAGEPVFALKCKKNMERELRNAIQNHVKQQVMDAIVAAHADWMFLGVDRPGNKCPAQSNVPAVWWAAHQDMDLKIILPDDMFKEQAERRVKLGFYCLK